MRERARERERERERMRERESDCLEDGRWGAGGVERERTREREIEEQMVCPECIHTHAHTHIHTYIYVYMICVCVRDCETERERKTSTKERKKERKKGCTVFARVYFCIFAYTCERDMPHTLMNGTCEACELVMHMNGGPPVFLGVEFHVFILLQRGVLEGAFVQIHNGPW